MCVSVCASFNLACLLPELLSFDNFRKEKCRVLSCLERQLCSRSYYSLRDSSCLLSASYPFVRIGSVFRSFLSSFHVQQSIASSSTRGARLVALGSLSLGVTQVLLQASLSRLSLSSLTLSLSLSVSLRAQRRSFSLFASSLLLFSSLFCSHLCSLLSSSSFCVWFVESTCWGKKRTKTEAKKRDERFRHLRVLNWMPTMRILLSFFFLSACNVSEETFFCCSFFFFVLLVWCVVFPVCCKKVT